MYIYIIHIYTRAREHTHTHTQFKKRGLDLKMCDLDTIRIV